MVVKMEPSMVVEMEPLMVESMKVESADPAEKPMSYEELRKHRVEENKQRMLEMGLETLAKSLHPEKKPAPAKRKAPAAADAAALVERRSSRVASKPAVKYAEAPAQRGEREKVETRHGLPKQYLKEKARMAAIDAAEEVLKGITNPAFIKPLLSSHTTGGFWMGLQNGFCKEHLPAEDEKLMLEVNGCEWECVYLAYKNGLSGGWRSFSIDNGLRDGDSCIFELVNRRRFVVHIFRAAREEGTETVDVKKAKKGPAKP